MVLMGAASVLTATAQDKPNIVLVMADDVSWEAFGCYGAEDYLTPRIDQMAAAKGVRFEHCYSTPICTPLARHDHVWAVQLSELHSLRLFGS